MSQHFLQNTRLEAYEREMMRTPCPNARNGLLRLSELDCSCCARLARTPCHPADCPWFVERYRAGRWNSLQVIRYMQAKLHTGRETICCAAHQSERHRERFQLALRDTGPSPDCFGNALPAALFLLGADDRLWQSCEQPLEKTIRHINMTGVTADQYLLLKYAKDLLFGSCHIRLEDWSDPQTVPDHMLGTLLYATAIRQYGLSLTREGVPV